MARTVETQATDGGAIRPSPDIFLTNMRALWRRDPALALQLDAIDDDRRTPIERTKSGAWTARVRSEDGQSAYLHSRHDPVRDAKRLAESVDLSGKHCLVVSGFGLGYHVREMFARMKGQGVVICAEPDVSTLAAAMSCEDYSEWLLADRLLFLTSGDKSRLHERLQPHNMVMMLGTGFVEHPPSMRTARRAHGEITASIAEFVTFTRMNLMTLVANSKVTCRNIAMNFATALETPPIDILKGRFRGLPAIVLAAGPSLSRNLELIESLQGKAILIAVQTVLRPLAERGITPDFVTSLDFHEMSRRFFEGVGNLDRVHLVAEPKATWHVLDEYPGPISVLDNSWTRLVLGDEVAARDGLKAGATVAHLALYLADYLGCDPILLAGQDLGFTGHVFYSPGVEIHRAWQGELSRFQSLEQKEWERIVRNRPILRKVRGVSGDALYTDELLVTYLEQFEKDIAEMSARVINVSGGANIRGTESADLEAVAKEHCRAPLPREPFDKLRALQRRDAGKLARAETELESALEELVRAIETCDELLELFEKLGKLTHDPPAFNRTLVRVDELRARVHRRSRAYRIINAATQFAELQRVSADLGIAADEPDEVARAKRQLARDEAFISAVREGAAFVTEILEESLSRVRARAELRS